MADQATSTATSTSLSTSPDAEPSSSDWGLNYIPAERKTAIFDEANLPSELVINVHHFRPVKEYSTGDEIKFAVEIVNKEEWEVMLEIQAINEINQDIIEEALAKKHLVVKLEIITHPMQGAVWEKDSNFAPDLEDCVDDWELFLQKISFKRMVTTVPYLLRKLNSPSGRSFVEELHYLQLTYDLPTPTNSDFASPPKWTQKAAAWKKAQDTGLGDRCASVLRANIEKQISRAEKYLPEQGMSAEFMGRLQERLRSMPDALKSKKYQLAGWEAGVIVGTGIGEMMSGSRFRKDPEGGVTLLMDVVWENV